MHGPGLTLEEYFALRPAQEEEPEAAPETADPEPAQAESAAPAEPVAPDPQPDPDLPMI